ncbi:BTB/POZ domain-containing protein [Camellia lanceoleosa]|uniref:BTB/POZ domain-containing protein n=1 Tax=Camellia lanceoleosa TaxID=1840588 RepID=A0ACC0IT71_9ERIC|nr:BTB/POZ domain-containing protein [Camellia lanceoleosa]
MIREQLRAKIEDLNSKVSFLRFWTPFDDYHHRSTPCFSDIVLVASDDDSGKPASNPIPVSAHKAVLDYDGDGKLSFSEFSDLINAFGNQLAADKVHPDLQI